MVFGRKPDQAAIKTSELRSFASARTGFPDWLVAESHDRVEDLAETLSLLVDQHGSGRSLALNEVVETFIQPLVSMDSMGRKELINQAWDTLGSEALLPFHKLLTGAFRMGVSKGNLCKALAQVGNLEPALVAQRLAGDWTPGTLSMEKILDLEQTESACQPFPFYLSYPVENTPSGELGSLDEWQVEWKWDGIRAQLIKRDGRVMIWSRGEESVGDSFPEIMLAANALPSDVCLDGEILAWGKDGLRSFSRLQRRLGRKTPGPGILKKEPVRFQAYDLLRLDGVDLGAPLSDRRKNWRMWWKHCQVISNLVFPPWFSKKLVRFVGPSRSVPDRGWRGYAQTQELELQKRSGQGDWYKWKLILYMPTWWW